VFAIEVEYLLGRVYAAEFRDNTAPEWPPHPARLFSALVAAHHDTEGTPQEREALMWLEQQAPPEISAGREGQSNRVVTFVPTNYAAKSGSTHPEQRTKQPRSFPVQSPASPTVHFVWRDSEPTAQHREALRGLVSRVAALGRASSLVRVRAVDMDSVRLGDGPHFVPDDDGNLVLAVARSGRMDELERSFAAGRRPQQGVQVRYANRDDAAATSVLGLAHFGEMIVLRRVTGIGFPIESTHFLTRNLRRAFLSQAGGGDILSPVLSGHDGENPTAEPHVAFAALPNVGGGFGDGRLMGLGVILPRSISKADRRIALRACASIETINFGEQLGSWTVEIANFGIVQRTLKQDTWMNPAKKWASVTPILLDRFPKKGDSTEELLITACVRAGLPLPVRCSYGTHAQASPSAVRGVAPVFAFKADRWAVHARIEFDSPVKGPVLLGAGRFFGMGLMKPLFGADDAGAE